MSEICLALNKQVFILWKKMMFFVRADGENDIFRLIFDLKQKLLCRIQSNFGLDVGPSTRIMSDICFALTNNV